MRVIGSSWTAPCALPPSLLSRMRLYSPLMTSGAALATGRIATDLERSQSTSAESIATRRPEAEPWTTTKLVRGSVWTEPDRLPNASSRCLRQHLDRRHAGLRLASQRFRRRGAGQAQQKAPCAGTGPICRAGTRLDWAHSAPPRSGPRSARPYVSDK